MKLNETRKIVTLEFPVISHIIMQQFVFHRVQRRENELEYRLYEHS